MTEINTYEIVIYIDGVEQQTDRRVCKALSAPEAAERAYTTAAGYRTFLGGRQSSVVAVATCGDERARFPRGRNR